MFPINKDDSLANIRAIKWLDVDECIIDGSHTQCMITTIGRTGLMTVAHKQSIQKTAMKSLILDLTKRNREQFTSRGAIIFLAIGALGYAVSLVLILITQFLFS